MALGDEQIGTYFAGYFGKSASIGTLTTQQATVAYLLGVQDAAASARAKTNAELTTALNQVFAPTGPDPYLVYYPNYLIGLFQAIVGQPPPLVPATSGGGLPLEGVNVLPAIASYAAVLGRRDANGPDPSSTALFTAHGPEASAFPFAIGSFTPAPSPGVVSFTVNSTTFVRYDVRGYTPNGTIELESVNSSGIALVPIVGRTPFSWILRVDADVAPGGETKFRQIMPIRSSADVVLALQAVF